MTRDIDTDKTIATLIRLYKRTASCLQIRKFSVSVTKIHRNKVGEKPEQCYRITMSNRVMTLTDTIPVEKIEEKPVEYLIAHFVTFMRTAVDNVLRHEAKIKKIVTDSLAEPDTM